MSTLGVLHLGCNSASLLCQILQGAADTVVTSPQHTVCLLASSNKSTTSQGRFAVLCLCTANGLGRVGQGCHDRALSACRLTGQCLLQELR